MGTNHTVTLDWGTGEMWPRETLNCNAPEQSMCHVVWDCECESWDAQGIAAGRPWHSLDGGESPVHHGKFDAGECNLRNWHENSEETLRGSLTIPVTPEFQGDHYTFSVDGEVSW